MHYRLVKRDNLTFLESAVKELMAKGWRLHQPEHGPTVGEALQMLHGDKENIKLGIAVSMAREWSGPPIKEHDDD